MSERERWIVYPLLFLALGAALRDKLVDRTTTKSIICQELIVVDEQPLGREPILLARIGRPDPGSSDHPSGGQLLLNGELHVVDRGTIAPNQVVKKLVRIGRAEQPQGAPAVGYVWVKGEVVVNGPINAMHYVYQGVPFMPALRKVLPGLPDLLPAVPQAVAPAQPESAPPQSSPAEPVEPAEPSSTIPAERSDDDSNEAQLP